MRPVLFSVFVAAGVGTGVAACEREQPPEPRLTPAALITSPRERAADELAVARCDREERCQRIGEGYYASRDHCLRVMLVSVQPELEACTNVDQGVLQSCGAEVRATSCEANIDRLDRLASCVRLCAP